MRLPAAWIGIFLFAAGLAAAEWLFLRRPPLLAARMLAAAVAGLLLFQIFPWTSSARWALRRHGLRHIALYFLFMAHFLRIFLEETVTLFRAWRLAFPRRSRAGWWRSLFYAAASLFPRSLRRAERFYSALLIQGFAR